MEKATKKDLVKQLKELGLKTSGSKASLERRLRDATCTARKSECVSRTRTHIQGNMGESDEYDVRFRRGTLYFEAESETQQEDENGYCATDGTIVGNSNEEMSEVQFHGDGGNETEGDNCSYVTVRQKSSKNKSDDDEVGDDNCSHGCVRRKRDVDRTLAKELLVREKTLLEKEVHLLKRERELLLKQGNVETVNKTVCKEKVLHPSEVVGIVPPFDPESESSLSSTRWIKKLKKLQGLYGWTDDTLLHYAFMRLEGIAKLWKFGVDEEITSWQTFEIVFLKKFPPWEDEADVHNQLVNRKRKPDESYESYVFVMVNIGKRCSLSEKAIVKYIIRGIQDPAIEEKLMVQNFQAVDPLLQHLRNYSSFKKVAVAGKVSGKQKLQVYPSVSSARLEKSDAQGQPAVSGNVKTRNVNARCFNCNLRGHLINNCPSPLKKKGCCFSCGKADHLIKDCPNKKVLNLIPCDVSNNEYVINVILNFCNTNDVEFKINSKALIDTGSPVSVIKRSMLPNYILQNLRSNDKIFTGINNSELKILGWCSAIVTYENHFYNLDLCVVSDNTMSVNLLLGRDFLSKASAKLTINSVNNSDKDGPLEVDMMPEIFNIDISDVNEGDFGLNINPNVPKNVGMEVHNIFSTYYANADRPATPEVDYEMHIRLNSEKIISQTPRRLSAFEKNEVKKITDELLSQGIIRHSDSPYSSPIVLAKKKNNEYRLCVDYRKINSITERDNYPLPLIDDLIDQLNNKRYFTSIDLKNSFHQVKVAEDSIKFTSFVTPGGQFEYVKMPFGLKNSPSNFQRYIHKVFRSLVDQGKVQIYMDDILIATKGLDEHLSILKEVLQILSNNHLVLRLDKCRFVYEEISYLGYVISADGIKPNQEKLQAVMNMGIPRNLKELRSFLGLTSYFRRFIQNFSVLSKPLYDLVRKEAEFEINEERVLAFETLKMRLVEAPILQVYCPTDYTELHCDASSHGFGAILMQRKNDGLMHPIAYFSKRTTEYEARYHSYELETLAVIYALRRFRVYLYGVKFKVITDCSALTMTLRNNLVNPRISRWMLELQNYDFDVEHRPFSKMQHVDALSRYHNILVLQESPFEQQLALCQFEDPKIKLLREELKLKENPLYEIRDDLVYRKTEKGNLLFYVPERMVIHILRSAHDLHGHVGVDKVCEIVKRSYWFPNMKSVIKDYVANCIKCIVYNNPSGKKEGFLYPIPKGDEPFVTLHIDHLGPLEETPRKRKHILVVVDCFTKFVKFYAVKSTTAIEAINCLKAYFTNYSIPLRLVSDRGTAFTSSSFRRFMKNNNIQHILVASGSPKSNGQVERINRDLVPMLAKLVDRDKNIHWDHVLSEVEYVFNNTLNKSTGSSPYRLLFGIDQRGVNSDRLAECVKDSSEDINKVREEIRLRAVENMSKSQVANKTRFDRKRKAPRIYKVNDLVMITNIDNTPGMNRKLNPRFRGPYKIIKALGNDRYLIRDVEGFQITSKPFEGIYDVSRIKPYINLRSCKN